MTKDYIEHFTFTYRNGVDPEQRVHISHGGECFTCIDICDEFFHFMKKAYGYNVLKKFLEENS